jgi:hypothetical protein
MSAGGKGHSQRPTDQKNWSNGYDNIQWTKEEDEEFERITEVQDGSSAQRTLAQARSAKETLPPA